MQVPSDSLRAALDSVFRSPLYDWRAEDPAVAAVVRWWNALIGWIAGLRDASPQLYRVFVAILAVLLVGILAHALWVLVRTVRGAAEPPTGAARPAAEFRRDAAWYFRSADALAAEGRFVDALQRAFVGVALTLDARGIVQYHASRTPVEVAREARLVDADRERLRGLVRTLYAAAFGGGRCGPDEYRAWRALADGEWHAAGH